MRVLPSLLWAVAFAGLVFGGARAPAATDDGLRQSATETVVVDAPRYSTDYKLGPGDKVRVTVFNEDDLSGEFQIDGSGYVRLPLIGQVRAGGFSAHQLEGDVEAALEDGYLKSPRVNVEVTTYRPFYIIGEVNKPGEYPYVNNMTVLNAVALAGGYTYRASESEVYVRRNGSKDEAKEPADGTAKILPGDIVRVPERLF